MTKFNPYERLKAMALKANVANKRDEKLEKVIREEMTHWEQAIKLASSEARKNDDYKAHIPEIPCEYVCPICHMDLKGKKVGILRGKNNARIHEKCLTQALLHDPSGYTYGWYKNFGLALPPFKMDKVYTMLGMLYNQIVDTMKMSQNDALVREEILIQDAPASNKVQVDEEKIATAMTPEELEQTYKTNQKFQNNTPPEWVIRKKLAEVIELSDDITENVISAVKYLYSIRKIDAPLYKVIDKVLDSEMEVMESWAEMYRQNIKVELKVNAASSDKEALNDAAKTGMKAKVNKMLSIDKRIEELMGLLNK